MKISKVRYFLSLLLLILAARSGAQEHNSVPLDHPAYEIIEMGIMRGVILPPPSAKPWSEYTIKQKLWEMMVDPAQILSTDEADTVDVMLDSLERKNGLELKDGRYRIKDGSSAFEIGLGWESVFSMKVPEPLFASINTAKIYSGGDLSDFVSWNITARGEFLYIDRENYALPSVFPYTFSKQWDGGVLSLNEPGTYAGWPDDPALAGGFEAELNGVFFDRRLQLRLGRIRHDWGHGTNRASLFLNSHARPFTSLEGTFMPLSWMNVSFLGGALEHFRENDPQPDNGPFSNMLTAAQIEFDPLQFLHIGIGGAGILLNQPNLAFFADLELKLPGLFTIWGSVFIDRLWPENSSAAGNSYAYQAGIKTVVHWLPLAAFTLSYTKIEPYCYSGEWDHPLSAFVNGGESLGYYLPPNSDELLIRFESMLLPPLKAYVQFQMIRHGVDYEYGAVPGSSLYDKLNEEYSAKYFLRDGVYQWDNIIKLGGSFNLKSGGIPLALFADIGGVITNFTINGNAGAGNEADYEPLNNAEYPGVNSFIFSIGFRLFP